MRTDPSELPLPSDGKDSNHYPAEELRQRAHFTATKNFPHIDAICELMGWRRAAKARMNPHIALPEEAFYGPPKLVIVDADFDIVHERPWDHTPYSLEQGAEIAQQFGGAVFLDADVYTPLFPNQERVWVDTGFSIEVWPRFRVRP